ncbi:hypothetical protein BDP55DRAFT_667852 [Colletotrichum godetiae]|uniref:Uncharacterized protein n=1 Tax=Colletotrichum godetiae TaxID=1209918 RepID=A0AAJ0EU77_9PEZI|nr:uncharacterized protein BDP55DRAFT_667852 [Colletotrichum godetiae]KAK1674063.1 hypothetical protein BDP55DRAFT_667852 [Colletotrichum godetiae]
MEANALHVKWNQRIRQAPSAAVASMSQISDTCSFWVPTLSRFFKKVPCDQGNRSYVVHGRLPYPVKGR